MLGQDSLWDNSILGQLVSSNWWGAGLLGLGIIQIISIHIHRARIRLAVCVFVLFIYLFIDINLWLSDISLSAATLFVFAILAAWASAIYSVHGKVDCGN